MVEGTKDQVLSLKVMRLARPKFHETVTMPIDPADETSQLIGSAICRLTGQEAADVPIGSYLLAPQKFENIYLGETFTFYVCVQNGSNSVAMDVCVKVDLQTTSQRSVLMSPLQEANATLGPGKRLGAVITQEIKEIGQHMYNNDVYLEAQIQNTSELPMVLEKVVLEPSEFYSSTGVAPANAENGTAENAYLNPNEIRQFLYCLKPKIVSHSQAYHRKGTSIGKLDMVWRTSMGERGHLQTSPLQRMAPGYGDLRLTVEKIPASVTRLEIFAMVCRLHNCSERPLDLVLTLDEKPQPNIVFCSTSNVELGQLPPNSTFDFTLNLLPLAYGLQTISGIRVTDTFLRRTYEHDEIAQVFVV